MEKKTFYGEYTLYHWIELILQKNIILPDYQRCFVWKKDHVETFLRKVRSGIFVPPVIIGSLEHTTNNENIILDGQQRLTSILLGYLGYYPKPDAFLSGDDPLYSDEEDDDDVLIEWSFKLLTNNERNKTKEDILGNIDTTKYEQIDESARLDMDFLNNNYLGFSYIVPINSIETEQQRFYSTVFHDINQQGVALQGQESRRSLYYLNSDLVPYFEPTSLVQMLKINQSGKTKRYDYVRLLSLLTQYRKENSEMRIAQKCRSQERFELYYEKYINAVVNDEDSPEFGKFSEMIGIDAVQIRTNLLKEYVEKLGFNVVFTNIVDADTKLFGLVYYVLFMDKQLDEPNLEDLKTALREKVNEFRSDEKHKDNPSGLTYIRQRIKQSIDIYSRYVL